MEQNNTTKIECSNCGQKLRIPYDRGDLRVTCPSCKTVGIWKEDSHYNSSELLQKIITAKINKNSDAAVSVDADLNWLRNSKAYDVNRGAIHLDVSNSKSDTGFKSAQFATSSPSYRQRPYYVEYAKLPFTSGIFDDLVDLVPGCIVAVRLGAFLEHTGVYVGNNKVVELYGDGSINLISTEDFISGSYKKGFPVRTAVDLYTACFNDKPVASEVVALRALKLVNSRLPYHILKNNCHMLSGFCFSGRNFQENTDCKFFRGLTKKIIDEASSEKTSLNTFNLYLADKLGFSHLISPKIFLKKTSNIHEFSWKAAKYNSNVG